MVSQETIVTLENVLSLKPAGCSTKIPSIVVKQMEKTQYHCKNRELGAHKWYRRVLHLVSQKDPSSKPLWPYHKLHWLQLQQRANHMVLSKSKNSCRDWLQSKPYRKASWVFSWRSPSIRGGRLLTPNCLELCRVGPVHPLCCSLSWWKP